MEQRRIMLPDVAIETLRSHKVAQEQARIKVGEKWVERGIVFTNTIGGFLSSNILRQLFHDLLKSAGLPDMRFHDLRHSAATILLGAKVQLKVVSERLGHASIATTADIYSHVLPEMQQEVVDKIDDVFKR
jgi:integrase